MPSTSGIVSGLSRDNVRSWRGEISFGPMLSITLDRSRRRPSPSITPGFSYPGLPYRHNFISSFPHRSSSVAGGEKRLVRSEEYEDPRDVVHRSEPAHRLA